MGLFWQKNVNLRIWGGERGLLSLLPRGTGGPRGLETVDGRDDPRSTQEGGAEGLDAGNARRIPYLPGEQGGLGAGSPIYSGEQGEQEG